MLKNKTYLKFERFLSAKPEEVIVIWNYTKMSTVLHQSATLWTTFTSALTKECQNYDRKQHSHMVNLANAPMSRVHIWPPYRTTSTQNQIQMLSKCFAFAKKKRWCSPDRKNSCMFGESGFRKSSSTVYLFTRFWYLPYKILLTISLILGKNKGKLQSYSSDLPYQEKLKHQWQLFILYLNGFHLRTQGYKMQTFVSQISIRSF